MRPTNFLASFFAVLCLMLAGCGGSSFTRGKMESAKNAEKPLFLDLDIKEIEALNPQIKIPFRLAVAPPLNIRWHEWTLEERNEITAWGDQLKKAGVVQDYILLPSFLLDQNTDSLQLTEGVTTGRHISDPLKAIHAAAARYNADAVLIIRGKSTAETSSNPLAFLYATIIGALFVPGSHIETESVIEGVVIDNRNDFLYVSADADNRTNSWGPIAFMDADEEIEISRLSALKEFGKQFVEATSKLRSK